MAGRKIKSISNKDLAYSHAAGAEVLLSQIAIHPIYGTFIFSVINHTDFYNKAALYHLEEAKKAHDKVISMPVGKQNARGVFDNDILGDFFHNAQLVVLFSYLWLEYFAMDCSRGLGKLSDWKKRRLDQKLKYLISQELGIENLPQELCTAFGEIEHRRHSLNHPEFKNVVHGSETEWDTVHLGWLIVGNFEKCFENATKIYNYLHEPYIKNMRERPSGPTTINIIQRGMEFKNPAKKRK